MHAPSYFEIGQENLKSASWNVRNKQLTRNCVIKRLSVHEFQRIQIVPCFLAEPVFPMCNRHCHSEELTCRQTTEIRAYGGLECDRRSELPILRCILQRQTTRRYKLYQRNQDSLSVAFNVYTDMVTYFLS